MKSMGVNNHLYKERMKGNPRINVSERDIPSGIPEWALKTNIM